MVFVYVLLQFKQYSINYYFLKGLNRLTNLDEYCSELTNKFCVSLGTDMMRKNCPVSARKLFVNISTIFVLEKSLNDL